MNMCANGFSRIVKAQFSAIIIMLTMGCTSTYKIEYLVNSAGPQGISSEDAQAITQSFLNDPLVAAAQIDSVKDPIKKSTDLPTRFYLQRHPDAHTILAISENENGLLLSVTRLTKSLGDFSEVWMRFFESQSKKRIERAINKTVEFSLLPR